MSTDRKHQLDRPEDYRQVKKPKLADADESSGQPVVAAVSPNVQNSETATPAPTLVLPGTSPEDEQRRKQEELRKIEQEFTQLKEKLFADKLNSIKREIEQLNEGTHEGFLGEVKLLEEKKQRRYLLAEQWRKYQVQSLDIICEAEKKMADDEFLNETAELKERMMKNLLKRRKALEEEKRDFSLGDTASSIQDSQRASTRQLRKRGARDQMDTGNGAAETRKPQVPEIRTTLTDEEIDSDIAAIQRALAVV